MNIEQWAYNEGARAALRSLGIKDDSDSSSSNSSSATPDYTQSNANLKQIKDILKDIYDEADSLNDLVTKGSDIADQIEDQQKQMFKIANSGSFDPNDKNDPVVAFFNDLYDSGISSFIRGNIHGNLFKSDFDSLKEHTDKWKDAVSKMKLD